MKTFIYNVYHLKATLKNTFKTKSNSVMTTKLTLNIKNKSVGSKWLKNRCPMQTINIERL